MDKIVIDGGVPLRGTVAVSGAKNAALPTLAAALLAQGDHVVRNVPNLADVRTMGRLLGSMECAFERDPEGHVARIRVPKAITPEAPYELVKTMRAAVVVLGPLVARWGKARVSLPGGCAIGARPIDQHLKGLAALGAKMTMEHGYVDVEVPAGRLVGTTFTFDMQTVTGTENVMMAAALADGLTVLRNCAREPEVVDLARALVRMGAKITGAGTDEVRIEGVTSLRPLDHDVIPDRIEAGTFLVAGALPGNDVTVKGCVADDLEALIEKLRAVGASVTPVDGGVRVALGTDSGGDPQRYFIQGFAEHHHMELMVQAGLTPMQVIQSFSQKAAETLRIDKDFGALAKGKAADLLVLENQILRRERQPEFEDEENWRDEYGLD